MQVEMEQSRVNDAVNQMLTSRPRSLQVRALMTDKAAAQQAKVHAAQSRRAATVANAAAANAAAAGTEPGAEPGAETRMVSSGQAEADTEVHGGAELKTEGKSEVEVDSTSRIENGL